MSSNLTARQKKAWLMAAASRQGWQMQSIPKKYPKVKKEKEEERMVIAIDDAIKTYFDELHNKNTCEEQAKEINEKCKEAKSKLVKTGQDINKILKDTKSDSILVSDEHDSAVIHYVVLPNAEGNITLKKILTEKEIKTKQAVTKLSKKTKEGVGILR